MAMIAFGSSAAARTGTSFAGTVLAHAARIIFWPVRVLRARRDLVVLAGLTDVELRDIGLSRLDLKDAAAIPLDVSPSGFLANRVSERACSLRRF